MAGVHVCVNESSIKYSLPGSSSVDASMEDTGALGWTEGVSHVEAAEEYMHVEKSMHGFTESTHSSHIEKRSGRKDIRNHWAPEELFLQ